MKLTVDFAFEGFKTLKTAPWAVPAWGCIILLAYAIGAAGLLPFAVPTIQKMINNGPVTDPSVVVTLMAQLILPYFLFILALLLAYNIVACAIYRIVLNRPKPNFAWVRLGSDEFRNIVVHILFGFIFMGVYMAALLGGGLAGGLVGYLLSLLNKDLMGLGLFLGIACGVVVMMWVLIRLSLFAIISFDRKQIDLFGSWKLTKGYVWTLLGGMLIAVVVAIAVESLCMIGVWVIIGSLLAANMNTLSQLGHTTTPDIGHILTVLAPMIVTYFVLMTVVVVPLMLTILMSAPAAAYRVLTGGDKDLTAKVF